MSFRQLQNSLSKTRLIRNSYFSYRCYVVQLCTAEQTEYDETFSKDRMHRILKLELKLEPTNNDVHWAVF